ncbi:HU family DNA-binding protein, partial [Candidatus Parcubacteria bacterium]|nr:HU family DNA-binding protein [Candidatus Parcubacteria bacterium]
MAAHRIKNIKDAGTVGNLVDTLARSGSVRLLHFGVFKVKTIKGHKRYDFKRRTVVPRKPYKQIIFTPAHGLREMLHTKKI